MKRTEWWTDAEKDELRRLYAKATWTELAAIFTRFTKRQIAKKAENMGLTRSSERVLDARRLAAHAKHTYAKTVLADPILIDQVDDLPQQVIVIRPAPAADGTVVRRALSQLTPLETAWMGK